MSTKENFPDYLYRINSSYCEEVPSTNDTNRFTEEMVNFLFPIREKKDFSREEIAFKLVSLEKQLEILLQPLKMKLDREPAEICKAYFSSLPGIYSMLLEDAEAFTRFDPASESVEEVILCYPGFYSIAVFRLAHELYEMKVPVLPRIMCEFAHGKTGVDIHPGASIGGSFFIDHGTGTVIGETAVIGRNVKIYQGVTLGALFVSKALADKKRHPTIEDDVIIYARSTILGGDTVVGHHTVVGGNVWLTESVLPYSVVYQKNKVVVRDSKDIGDEPDWII